MAEQKKLRKCPACGAVLTSFATRCPDCGAEIIDIEANSNVKEFADRIDSYDAQIDGSNASEKSGVSLGVILLWIFLFPFMMGWFLFKMYSNNTANLQGVAKQKANYIMNFPIPNSRNDLLEFGILVESQVETFDYSKALTKAGGDIQAWNKVWLSKMDQIVKKSKISMKDEPSTLGEINKLYAMAQSKVKSNQSKQYTLLGALGVVFVAIIVIAMISK